MDLGIVAGGVVAAGVVIAATEAVARGFQRRAAPASVAAAPATGGIRQGLRGTRSLLAARLAEAFGHTDGETFDRLEEALIAADVGVRTTHVLVEAVRGAVGGLQNETAIREALRREMVRVLEIERGGGPAGSHPHVVLVVGVNGVGKTTTIAKLAARYHARGRRVLLVAADTFRAAAADQLEAWAAKLGVGMVRHRDAGNPAAVVFDGMAAAIARDVDVVLVDTAGRLHTRRPLVEELRKVRRVISEAVPDAPQETLVVLDATTGQNALAQARTFAEAVAVTGVVLTKLDGTAKGGIALAIAHELGFPITDVGIGERAEDLRPFDARDFVAGILGEESPSVLAKPQELQP